MQTNSSGWRSAKDLDEMSFTIGQIAHRTGIPARTIRFYEGIGLLPRPPRGPNSYRRYSPADLNRLLLLRRIRLLGLPFPRRNPCSLARLTHDAATYSGSCSHWLKSDCTRLTRKSPNCARCGRRSRAISAHSRPAHQPTTPPLTIVLICGVSLLRATPHPRRHAMMKLIPAAHDTCAACDCPPGECSCGPECCGGTGCC